MQNQIPAHGYVNRRAGRRYTKQRLLPLARAFWSKVEIAGANSCWKWLGTCRPSGYGDFRPKVGKRWRAHRLALSLHDGRERMGIVRHLCDNARCCNPNHLAWGSDADNAVDRMEAALDLKAGPLHPRSRATRLNATRPADLGRG